jgi:CRISPR-associated protein Cas1
MQLVLNTHGTSLKRKAERFLVRIPNRTGTVEIAAAKIQSIVVASSIHLTSSAIELAIRNNIDICFVDKSGTPFSRLWQSRMGSTVTIRREQLIASDTDVGLSIALGWVQKKIGNQSAFLKQLAARRPKDEEAILTSNASIEELSAKLQSVSGLLDEQRGTIMGLEGVAGRVYYDCLAKLMPSEYPFSGRSRQPAADAFNAMLNYSYGVLYSLVERSCILAGLDPYIGLLHTDNYNKRSLVFDMIEPFRIIGERATVLFFTGRRVKAEYFRSVPGGIELAPEGRAALITNMNERLDKSVKYPTQRTTKTGGVKYRRIKLRVTIQYEAHAMANRLLGKTDMPRIVDAEELFDDET